MSLHASAPLTECDLSGWACAGNKDNYEKAISCYREALQHNPTLKEAAYGLGLVLANTKAYHAAIEAFNQVPIAVGCMYIVKETTH